MKDKRKKLTARAVRSIRASRKPLRIFAKRYGVTIAACSLARKGVTWKNVDG